ncbi:MAG: hypothetical protein ACQEQ7_05175 [Thermodesulfobacteriota bacterium]
MKRLLLLMCISLVGGSCSPNVGPKPLTPSALSENRYGCHSPFPHGEWQFVHAIEGTLPHDMKTSAMGITEISSREKTVRCVLMTVEGFVLFDGVWDQEIKVNRAVQPFDSPAFAAGLMNDIRSIFFPPKGKLAQTGRQENGAHVCRYRQEDKTVVDVITGLNGEWMIHHYKDNRLIRSVHAYPGEKPVEEIKERIPPRITLSTDRPVAYTLNFRLIQAEPVKDRD